jgi:Protein of unknown function (DUF3617)
MTKKQGLAGATACGMALTLCLTLGLVSARAAEAPKPGLWKIVSATQRPDKNIERSRTVCLTAEQLDFSKRVAPEKKPPGSCRRSDVEQSANGVSWRIRCPDPLATYSVTKFILDTANHYSGSVSLTLTKLNKTSTVTFDARRVGECGK